MTLNPAVDGTPFSAILLNAQHNAHAGEWILNGCTPSTGTGDFDVDIASGEAYVADTRTDVSAQTETLTSPANDADLDSGEARADTISVDSTGTTNTAEGTAAAGTDADPVVAPDIPADEVAICTVLVDGDATSLSSSDINDYRTLYSNQYPIIREDGNSPLTATDTGSATITLSGTYDTVLVLVQRFENNDGSNTNLQIRIDGDTGTNYRYTKANGTESTGQTEWEVGLVSANGDAIGGGFLLTLSDAADDVGIMGPFGDGEASETLLTGKNSNNLHPVSSITFLTAGTSMDISARVYGWDGFL